MKQKYTRLRALAIGALSVLSLISATTVAAHPHKPNVWERNVHFYQHDFNIPNGVCNKLQIHEVYGVNLSLTAPTSLVPNDAVPILTGEAHALRLFQNSNGRMHTMDALDGVCIASVLEKGTAHEVVRWVAPEGSVTMQLLRQRDADLCQEFEIRGMSGPMSGVKTQGVACRNRLGAWQLMSVVRH